MTPRDEALLAAIKKLTDAKLVSEIAALRRKLKAVTEARDDYRETAKRYQKQILEMKAK